MHLAPDVYCRPKLLAALEAELFGLRRRPPALAAAFATAFRRAAGDAADDLDALRRVGARIVDAVETASRDGELAYHDRHHIVEAVLAMGWLCGMARGLGSVAAHDAALGVVAMVGHDLLHDGSPPCAGILEARAAAAVDAVATDLDPWQRGVIWAVILGTDPGLVAANAARAARTLSPGPLGRSVDLVVAMANEADVFASLLPNLGAHLTRRLIAERQSAGYDAAELDGPGHRRAFLLAYARPSLPARRLGLADLCDWQIAGSEPAVWPGAHRTVFAQPADRCFPAETQRIALDCG